MRCSLIVVGLFLACALMSDAAVVQRRYRNAQEILVPVTVIQDGEVIPDSQPAALSQLKADEALLVDIPQLVQEEPQQPQQPLEATEAVIVQAQRRIDNDIIEEEIQEVIQEEKKELLNEIKEKEKEKEEEQLEVAKEKEEVLKQEHEQELVEEELKKPATEELLLLTDEVSNTENAIKEEEQPVTQLKSLVDKEVTNEEELPAAALVSNDDDADDAEKSEVEGLLRQGTQAPPSQSTTQQNFVQQLIQNSPLGQFFNQISGQSTQAPNEDPSATPSPPIPGFLAPAITAAQNVVNTTTSAFQGLQQFASNLGNQFQNTLSSLGGQPAQQNNPGDVTTARPPGPFQQLVNTFMGNNNQQGTPAPQQGPLQGLLNIFQGNNNNQNQNKPQTNEAASANLAQEGPAKQPEAIEEPQNDEGTAENAVEEISNEIRNSAESEDSFEEVVQPEELIVVQDEAPQRQSEQV